ncbi:hypothetical protein CROQUDRAFT_55427, partial [Cronartium quercuum f. sp. fusiforme G11]
VIGMFLIGTMTNQISRSLYEKIRSLMGLCDLGVPEWSILCTQCVNLKKRLQMIFIFACSFIFDQANKENGFPQELANPYVCEHLVTNPELSTYSPINHISQSKRWRETFEPGLRVPMVDTDEGHFYIYELAHLFSQMIVVPIYFYQTEDDVFAKCVIPTIKFIKETGKFNIQIPLTLDLSACQQRVLANK